MAVTLGRLEAISVREIWIDEARDFTPWLAEAENLSLLGEALGLALELEARERSVGPFSADILARDVARNVWVVIENQLEATDHRHLGQLLTYAAGLEASTVVWVAPDFREEHRAAIDWLNHATAAGFDFFGVQVELLRIGDSVAAPRFNVVAKPNDWSKSAAAGKRQIEQAGPTESHKRWMAYWSALITAARGRFDPLGARAPGRGNWQPVMRLRGEADLTIDLVATSPRAGLRVEIYIDRELAKEAFAVLESRRPQIEEALGSPLVWELLPNARASRISYYMPGETGANLAKPGAQHEWFLQALPRLSQTLKPYIEAIDVSALRAEADSAAG